MGVQRIAQGVRRRRAGKVEMADLRLGMHAGIRPPGAVHTDGFAAKRRNRLFQRLLHGIAVGLPLPADEFRAVIFES